MSIEETADMMRVRAERAERERDEALAKRARDFNLASETIRAGLGCEERLTRERDEARADRDEAEGKRDVAQGERDEARAGLADWVGVQQGSAGQHRARALPMKARYYLKVCKDKLLEEDAWGWGVGEFDREDDAWIMRYYGPTTKAAAEEYLDMLVDSLERLTGVLITIEPPEILANIEDLQNFQATDTVWGPKIRRYSFLIGASWSALTQDERRECETLCDELKRVGFNPGWEQAP